MAHSVGFEPTTARFVAEYSIQLSYECMIFKGRHYSEVPLGSQLAITFINDGGEGGIRTLDRATNPILP